MQRQPVVTRALPRVQASSLRVSSPQDASEREAVATARQVMRMSAPVAMASTPPPGHAVMRQVTAAGVGAPRRFESPYVARFRASGGWPGALEIQRSEAGGGEVSAGVAGDIRARAGGGAPLPGDVRSFMEPRFGADFSGVRIHTDDSSARLSGQLNAHAFTVGNSIFFGRDKFQPSTADGRELIAHELTHTIQQGAAVQRAEAVPVVQSAPESVQCFGLGDALDYIADKANYIPGFRMFTVILGVNPVNMSRVERSAANILRALIEFIPGGPLITQAMENHGVFARVGAWVEAQVQSLGMTGAAIKQGLTRFLDSLSWRDIFRLGDVWDRAKRIFTEPIDRLLTLARNLIGGVIQFIKDAILIPLAQLARKTRGYDLLCAVLGKDPITGQPVDQGPEAVIGGFLKLIGQEEIWENIKRANAIARAQAWFKATGSELVSLVRQVPDKFLNVFRSLEILDIILLPRVLFKVGAVFVDVVGSFISWAGRAVWNLLEIIFDVLAPGMMVHLRKLGGALRDVLRDPLPFVKNLVKAAKLGFQKFADNFKTHLIAGFFDWLTGSLPGVYIPKSFDLREFVRFVLSVLGISWGNVRSKLVKAVGEPMVKGMETGFDLVVTLVREGPAAAWDKMKEQLANLRDQVLGGIVSYVAETIVTKAVLKLVSLFVPGLGFISAIISIYDTIMVFVRKISKIIQVVTGFLNSIAEIAAGAIDTAAEKVEGTLAGLIVLAINFLMGFLGLTKVSDGVKSALDKVRGSVDKALDSVVNWIVTSARKLWSGAKGAVQSAIEWWKERKPFKTAAGESHEIFYTGSAANAVPMVASKDPMPIEQRLGEFKAQAASATATPEQKAAAGLIAATLAALKANPADAAIVANMKQLFDLFEGNCPAGETKLVEQTGSLGGETVGLRMTVDWLDVTFAKKTHKGSPPGKGVQAALMKRLITGKKNPSDIKYIRGHLLNENLGGKGVADNLFPLTGYANGQHLHSTETRVKDWLTKPRHWIFYDVKVDSISSVLDQPAQRDNSVSCVFNCRAVLKTDKGKEVESFVSSIPSKSAERKTGQVYDLTHDES